MDCLADAVVSAAPARVGDPGIDVDVGGLRLVLQKRDGAHDHPRLAVAALGDVELLPGELDRVGSIGRQSFDGGDRSSANDSGRTFSATSRLSLVARAL
jgi:hypothetical protein